ncbi:MAG: response regulator [bacterium]|nr:response regulator [bacterium]
MGYKILVVDDETTIRDLVAFRLEFHGHLVLTAENGTKGLEKLRAEKPDLVVLDVMMPDLTGLEVLKTMKADPELASIKVIMLTAKGRKQDEDEGLAAGADAYMAKPFRATILLQKIEGLMNA